MNDMLDEPRVRYSEAQLAMLATLGLVPWVRHAVAPGASARDDASTASASAPPSPPRAEATVEPRARRGGLAGRPLAGFARRGERRFDTGPDDAPVLVLAEPVPAAGAPDLLPLGAADGDLLQAMLRAIDLGPGDHATALLAAGSGDAPDAPHASGAPSVADRLGGRRAVIWLCHEAVPFAPDATPDDTLDGVPVFRIAHPALLRERPLAKRDAWRTLKRVRARLSTPGGGASSTPVGGRR